MTLQIKKERIKELLEGYSKLSEHNPILKERELKKGPIENQHIGLVALGFRDKRIGNPSQNLKEGYTPKRGIRNLIKDN